MFEFLCAYHERHQAHAPVLLFHPLSLCRQSTVSESTLVALLAARKDMILQLQTELNQEVDDSVLNARLVAY